MSVRKGTHSCYECRKLKIRCIFIKDSSICGNCDLRGKKCIEQRRELVRSAALDTRESLRDKVARLEGIIKAFGDRDSSSAPGQVSERLESSQEDRQSDEIKSESSPSSIGGKLTPKSISSSLAAPTSVDENPSQDIDPVVTLFDNAIVSLTNDHGTQAIFDS